MLRRQLMILGAASLPWPRGAVAQGASDGPNDGSHWPTRPVRVVVPRAPGGTGDFIARMLADHFGQAFGERFIVENQPEAAGLNGLRRVVSAPPDGQTLLASDSAVLLASPLLRAESRIDPVADLSHIVLVAEAPLVLVAHPDGEATTLSRLLELGRQGRRDLFCATAGVGSHGHLVCDRLRSEALRGLAAVPYRGGAPAASAVLAREVPLAVTVLGSALSLIAEGRLVALAVTSDRRSEAAPAVPTFREFGFPQLVISNWYGLSGPPGLPPAIARRLQGEVLRWLEIDAVRRTFVARAYQAAPLVGDAFREFVDRERSRWEPVLRSVLQGPRR